MNNDDVKELITRRRRQILIHSCIYYRLNSSIWTDTEYDAKARELQELQEKYPGLAAECPYYADFKDFTESTTGFSLPIHDPSIVIKAQRLLEYHNKKKG